MMPADRFWRSPMKIEHAAWQVADPVAAADWYCEHLGMKVVRAGGPPANGRFLADATGRVLLEIYNNPAVDVPDYAKLNPLHLHLAFVVDDVTATRDRLVAAGATVHEDVKTIESGDQLLMLRDPWGFALQVLKRAEAM
jgi:catechol 2,3-dioxygenase-like lactoylglutathione lyase family enzyme